MHYGTERLALALGLRLVFRSESGKPDDAT